MLRIISFTSFLLIFLILRPNPTNWTWAQTDSSIIETELSDLLGEPVRIETVGGGSFQGTLLNVSEDRIEILVADGQILQMISLTFRIQ